MVNCDAASGLAEIIVYDLTVAGNGTVAVNADIPTGGPGATAASVAALDAYFTRLGGQVNAANLEVLVLAALAANKNHPLA